MFVRCTAPVRPSGLRRTTRSTGGADGLWVDAGLDGAGDDLASDAAWQSSFLATCWPQLPVHDRPWIHFKSDCPRSIGAPPECGAEPGSPGPGVLYYGGNSTNFAQSGATGMPVAHPDSRPQVEPAPGPGGRSRSGPDVGRLLALWTRARPPPRPCSGRFKLLGEPAQCRQCAGSLTLGVPRHAAMTLLHPRQGPFDSQP
jgi:hypothetical protein